MHRGKEEFLEHIDEIEDDLAILADIVESTSDFGKIGDEDFEYFVRMDDLLERITERLLPMSLFVYIIMHEGRARRAERN